MFDWKNWHSEYSQRIESTLAYVIPSVEDGLDQLHPAMAYAVQAGGKRIRPLLIYEAWQLGLKEQRQAIEQVN